MERGSKQNDLLQKERQGDSMRRAEDRQEKWKDGEFGCRMAEH